MKLVVYNKMNALPFGQKSKERTIRFNQSNGVIYISRFLAKEMELKDGDKIIFANDEESKKDWFIGKTNDEYGFVLHSSKPCFRKFIAFALNGYPFTEDIIDRNVSYIRKEILPLIESGTYGRKQEEDEIMQVLSFYE